MQPFLPLDGERDRDAVATDRSLLQAPSTAPPGSTPGPDPEPGPGTTRGRARRLVRRVGFGVVGLVVALGLVLGGAGADRLGLFGSLPLPPAAPTNPTTESAQFALIRRAWDLINTQYVARSSLNPTTLAYGAIEGLTGAVGDTGHTSFESPQDLAQERAALSGSYVGIGVSVDVVGGLPTIQGVFADSPAAEAGLRAGDQIIAVDGTVTEGLSIDAVTGTIRGPAGSPVKLSIRSPGAKADRSVTLVRRSVALPVVEWAMVPGTTVADIQLEQFSEGATDKLVAAIRAARAKGATGIILDLRGNPGGLVSEARGVASQFLASGLVYQAEDANGTKTPVAVQEGGIAPTLPLVVLVDHATASSSEIVAGAIQDAGRAKIVGQTTFGTGTVLSQFDLGDGSAIRIGTIQWLTPKGNAIWHKGIVPDQSVALASGVDPLVPATLETSTAAKVEASGDAQLLAALRLLGAR
jgi:carboxyl-terminal processing protease